MKIAHPRTLDEALEALQRMPDAQLLAGGTDFVVEVNFGHRRPPAVVGLRRVAELQGWRQDDGELVLGAGLTFTEIETQLAEELPALAAAERQLELIRQYPDLAGAATREGRLPTQSVVDQAIAGLDRLSGDEYTSFDTLNHAYREKFGFPLVVAVRENTKETILRAGNARLQNSPAAEQAAALVEIANLRLLDLVEEPVDRPLA